MGKDLLESSPHPPHASAGVHAPHAPLALVPLVLALPEALLFGILEEVILRLGYVLTSLDNFWLLYS